MRLTEPGIEYLGFAISRRHTLVCNAASRHLAVGSAGRRCAASHAEGDASSNVRDADNKECAAGHWQRAWSGGGPSHHNLQVHSAPLNVLMQSG